MGKSVHESKPTHQTTKPVKNKTGTGEGLKVIGAPGRCWCGKYSGHEGLHDDAARHQ